jgi:hypothetical protein
VASRNDVASHTLAKGLDTNPGGRLSNG